MNFRIGLGLVLVGFIAGAATLWLARGLSAAKTDAQTSAATEAVKKEPEVLYWYDPMMPQQRFDAPGPSPFMDMQLVPKYASVDTDASANTLSIDPGLVQSLGVRTAVVKRGILSSEVLATGVVAFDERAVAIVSSPVAAIVERLHVRAPMSHVQAGTTLFTLLAPEWTAAQEEYLSIQRATAPQLEPLIEAARQRLILLGMSSQQITRLESLGKVNPRIVVVAPQSGLLSELMVRDGESIVAGTALAKINGLSKIWINAAVPERQASLLRAGDRAFTSVNSIPGRTFEGRIESLLPSVDATTRTLVARVVIDNPQQELVAGMYATLQLIPDQNSNAELLIPSEALIDTGTRQVVVIALGKGKFATRDVVPGRRQDGSTAILHGLEAGERVVLSGQFLIDSEESLSGFEAKLDKSESESHDSHGDHTSAAPTGTQVANSDAASHDEHREHTSAAPKDAQVPSTETESHDHHGNHTP